MTWNRPARGSTVGLAKVGVIVILAVVIVLAAVGAIVALGLFASKSPSTNGGGSHLPPGGSNFTVSLVASGLGSGAPWSGTLNGVTRQASGNGPMSFSVPNGSYPFTVTAPMSYSADPSRGTVTVSGANVSESIRFSATTSASYEVSFTETGLPPSTSWSVTLNGTPSSATSSSIAFREPNGSYAFSAAASGYTAVPGSGTIPVHGANVQEPVQFRPSSLTSFAVTFSETGLPSGTLWSVTFNGTDLSSLASTISTTEPNGSYPFTVGSEAGYAAVPSAGTANVHGLAVTITVEFRVAAVTGVAFNLTFDETGLGTILIWGVSAVENSSGALFASTTEGSRLVFDVPNGTYLWSTFGPTNELASPSEGTVVVAGAARTVSIGWTALVPTKTNYTVTFVETGLASGTDWLVEVNATGNSTTSSSMTLALPNGTYSFFAVSASGPSTNTVGSFSVDGAGATVSVRFPVVYQVEFLETGIQGSDRWAVTLDGLWLSSTAGVPIFFNTTVGAHFYYADAIGLSNAYNYTASPSEGNFTLTSSGSSFTVAYARVSGYTVTVREHGLPTGASWYAFISAQAGYSFASGSTFSSIPYTLPNGTYYYLGEEYAPNTSYVPDQYETPFVVAGGPVTLTVTFHYLVGVHEVLYAEIPFANSSTYLMGAMNWSVTINGQTNYGEDNIAAFALPNGTYSYTITPPAGYAAYPSGGSLTVADPGADAVSGVYTNLQVFVTFVPLAALPGHHAPPSNQDPGGPGNPPSAARCVTVRPARNETEG